MEHDNGEEERFDAAWVESFAMSTYKYSEIMDAFEISEDSTSRVVFHIVHNNCATFPLSMAKQLGYTVSHDLMEFAASKLTLSVIPKLVRDSLGGEELTSSLLDVVEEDGGEHGLMQRLVKYYVNKSV